MKKKIMLIILLLPFLLIGLLFVVSSQVGNVIKEPDVISFALHNIIPLKENEKVELSYNVKPLNYSKYLEVRANDEERVKITKENNIFYATGLKEGKTDLTISLMKEITFASEGKKYDLHYDYLNSSLIGEVSDNDIVKNIELSKTFSTSLQDEDYYGTYSNSTLSISIEAKEYLYLNKSTKVQYLCNISTKSDTILSYVYSSITSDIYLYDPYMNNNGLSSNKVYGCYDLDSLNQKVNARINLKVLDFSKIITSNGVSIPSNKASINVLSNNANITYQDDSYLLEVLSNDDVIVEATSLNNPLISSKITLKIIKDAINVYSYKDLLYGSNHSLEGTKMVLRVNLESYENYYLNEETKEVRFNTSLLGYLSSKDVVKNSNNSTDTLYYYQNSRGITLEYLIKESLSDTRYLKRLNKPSTINIGLNLKQDFYGNGFSLNFDELTYPSGKVTSSLTLGNITSLASNDLYRGPLSFCGVYFDDSSSEVASIYGDDNVALYVSRNDVNIDNLHLKATNNVNSLNDLNYVGTTLALNGNNITLKNSIIEYGHTVIRSYSNKNVIISNCLIRNGMDFLLKLGSNSYLTSPSYDPNLNYNLEERIDNEMKIIHSYFNNSGFFSLGIEAHFNGEYLYSKNEYFKNTLPFGSILSR